MINSIFEEILFQFIKNYWSSPMRAVSKYEHSQNEHSPIVVTGFGISNVSFIIPIE